MLVKQEITEDIQASVLYNLFHECDAPINRTGDMRYYIHTKFY